jgi:PAS domain S-box-containing protein
VVAGVRAAAKTRDKVRRKMTERERAVEEPFRLLLDNVKDYAIITLDPQGRVTSWNPAAERIKGYRAEEIIGQHFSRFYPPEDVDAGKPERELAAAVAEGRMEDEGWRVRKDGSQFWANVVITALRDKSGALRGFGKVTRDVTERMQITRALEQRTADLERANKELEAFSYSVSHDLRAPLRGIDGFSLALLEDYGDQLDARGHDYLRRVRHAAQRMSRLIDDMLMLSRLSRAEVCHEQVDLTALAESVVAALRAADPDRAVEVTVVSGAVVTADPRLMRVVLDNLLGNAWKFTRGAPAPRIELGITERDGRVIYFVRDNGVGFDMAYASKLFQPFQRLHAATDFEGNGIGLATVQRAIHRQGGQAWAESALGRGATFFFAL